jgi:hypothetical protein
MAHRLEYERPEGVRAYDGRTSLKLGVAALLGIALTWLYGLTPSASLTVFGVLFIVSSAVALSGAAVATFALLHRRRRHPLALAGLFTNLIVLLLMLVGLVIGLSDN